MSGVTFSSTMPSAITHRIAWMRIWRFDAVCNLLISDMMLFAAVPIQKTLDMSSGAVTPIRLIGAVVAVYSLLQLWFTRRGEPPARVYQMAGLDMIVTGVGFAAVPLAGVEMNAAGVAVSAVLSVGSWLLVGLYTLRSRQLAE